MNEPIDLFGDQEFSSPLEAARFAADFLAAHPDAMEFYLVPEKVDEPEQLADFARRAILAHKAITASVTEPTVILPVQMQLMIVRPGENREAEAHEANIHRFALLDLATGHRDPLTEAYLLERGLTAAEYAWFMDHGLINIQLELRSDTVDATAEYLDRYGLNQL